MQVQLGRAGCAVSPARIANGPVTFAASNTDDTATSEVAVQRDGVVLAEDESVAPGLSGTFALDLQAGSYEVVCLHVGGTSLVPLTVLDVPRPALTGAALVRSERLTAAVAGYRSYLAAQTALLLAASRPLVAAVLAGDRARAEALYPAARAPYERIEPVAEAFPDLDAQVDERLPDVPAGQDWAGFHRIEHVLWTGAPMTGAASYARNLLADLAILQARTAVADLQPAQLADGAVSLLDEVGRTKVTGEEEAYSHLDLVDVRANVDGALETFGLLAPVLPAALVAQVRAASGALDAALARYRSGAGFVSYAGVDAAGRRALAADVDALAEPLSRVAALVTG